MEKRIGRVFGIPQWISDRGEPHLVPIRSKAIRNGDGIVPRRNDPTGLPVAQRFQSINPSARGAIRMDLHL